MEDSRIPKPIDFYRFALDEDYIEASTIIINGICGDNLIDLPYISIDEQFKNNVWFDVGDVGKLTSIFYAKSIGGVNQLTEIKIFVWNQTRSEIDNQTKKYT